MKPYLLRIMAPGAFEDVLDDIESDLPFGSISVGDLLDPEQYRHATGQHAFLLKVSKVEHKLFQSEKVFQHCIRVFTEEVPDNAESRGLDDTDTPITIRDPFRGALADGYSRDPAHPWYRDKPMEPERLAQVLSEVLAERGVTAYEISVTLR